MVTGKSLPSTRPKSRQGFQGASAAGDALVSDWSSTGAEGGPGRLWKAREGVKKLQQRIEKQLRLLH